MSDLPKLRDAGGIEGSLIRALEDERPSEAARVRMTAALGLGAAVAGASSVASGASAAKVLGGTAAATASTSGAGAAATAAKAGTLLGAAGALKWGSALVVLGVAGGFGLARMAHPEGLHSGVALPAPARPPARPFEPANANPSAAAPLALVLSAPPGATASAPPSIEAPRAPQPRRRNHSNDETAAVPSLSRELSSLEGVRRAIDKGDARRALAKLEAHDREYPSGALSIEAEYLRIESLIAAGKRGAARASAERFLAAHPGAPQARRVQSLLRGLAAE